MSPEQVRGKIFKIMGAQQPNLVKNINDSYHFKAEYGAIHGSAGSDKALLTTGYSDASFAYGILTNGAIIQFYENDALPHGALGPYAALNNDACIDYKTIAIELSLKLKGIIKTPGLGSNHEVINPNEAQKSSCKYLVNYLTKKHKLKGFFLSSTPVMNKDRFVKAVSYKHKNHSAHTDTHSWIKNKSLLTSLGINYDLFKEYDRITRYDDETLKSIKQRLELAKKVIQKKLGDGSNIETAAIAYEYWRQFLVKNQTKFNTLKVQKILKEYGATNTVIASLELNSNHS